MAYAKEQMKKENFNPAFGKQTTPVIDQYGGQGQFDPNEYTPKR
jgi:hypothetical protein